MSKNFYEVGYGDNSNYVWKDSNNSDGKTIFELEQNVIQRLNEYNKAYFDTGYCKALKSSNKPPDSKCSSYKLANGSWNSSVNMDSVYSTNLDNAINDLKQVLNSSSLQKDDINKYNKTINDINDLVKQINATRSEYDPKLQQIIENSNRSNSQNAVDSTVYAGIVISIGLASLLFFAFAKADSMK